MANRGLRLVSIVVFLSCVGGGVAHARRGARVLAPKALAAQVQAELKAAERLYS